LPDQELLLYLLQLLQALKFEGSANERTVRVSSNTVTAEDSGLADFLIDRSVRNPVLGNRFHWYLMVEVALEDKTSAKVFGKVWFKFMERLKRVRCDVLKASLLGTFIQCRFSLKMARRGQKYFDAKTNFSLPC
jgi:hypothetical protein